MTNDKNKAVEKKFDSIGLTRSSSNPDLWKDKHNNPVVKRESEERFGWIGSSSTTGAPNTIRKAGKL